MTKTPNRESLVYDPLNTPESKSDLAKRLIDAIPSYIPNDLKHNKWVDEQTEKVKQFIIKNKLLPD